MAQYYQAMVENKQCKFRVELGKKYIFFFPFGGNFFTLNHQYDETRDTKYSPFREG